MNFAAKPSRLRSLISFSVCSLIFGTLAMISPAGAQTTQPISPERLAAIRTPAAPATPRINGARAFGVRPGRPFIFHIAATGDKPITYSAAGLPAGLTLDAATGNITGSTSDAGPHAVTLTATNAKGSDTSTLNIVVGDTICLTPPMGWNSWNFFAGRVTQADIKGAADSMVKTGLVDHGWTYINIDDTWEAPARDGKIQSDPKKFPDMKGLSDYIHSQGLKFGIYSSPGPTTCARFLATYQHEDQDAQSYADWGVDYVKYDWCSYGDIAAKITMQRYATLLSQEDGAKLQTLTMQLAALPQRRRRTADQNAQATSITDQITAIENKMDQDKKNQIDLEILQAPYKVFRTSLDKVNRDIVYSLCQYGDGNVSSWGGAIGGNLWRTTTDISANWRSMSNLGFNLQSKLTDYAKPGNWNDPDMLEVGNGSLTPDENYTHMTLWCMLAAPLLIGCDMPHMDAFTVSLFSNDEVLAVDQDSLGKQGYRLTQDGASEVWVKPLADGTWAVALFNRGAATAKVSATWADLKLSGPQPVRDLWREKDLTPDPAGISADVASHGAEIYKVGTPTAH
jgi:alpha-galactosidase